MRQGLLMHASNMKKKLRPTSTACIHDEGELARWMYLYVSHRIFAWEEARVFRSDERGTHIMVSA
jgi:hypothetical protein